jgi:hypothetical protein
VTPAAFVVASRGVCAAHLPRRAQDGDVPSYHDVTRRIRAGKSVEDVGRELGASPGLVYMIATGLPADGSDTLGADDLARDVVQPTTQHLVGAPVAHPTHKDSTHEWIRRRAAADAPMQAAAGRGFSHHTASNADGE